MRFRSYDTLRVFDVAARHLSFTAAADELNLTKGAVSYQINRLENELGFKVFHRKHRGIALTDKGKTLWHASQSAFNDLERQIEALRETDPSRITIGMTTYFASRWLSPRLMHFTSAHPHVGLRLQPVMGPGDLRKDGIDLSIRWGKGQWTDVVVERLFRCPSFPTAGAAIAKQVKRKGIKAVLPKLTLLHDRDDSDAWADWHKAAGLPYRPARDGLVIPDPNVRVQAVIDGQGAALNDALVSHELDAGQLFQISKAQLNDYGYFLAYPEVALNAPALKAFRDWIVTEANAPVQS